MAVRKTKAKKQQTPAVKSAKNSKIARQSITNDLLGIEQANLEESKDDESHAEPLSIATEQQESDSTEITSSTIKAPSVTTNIASPANHEFVVEELKNSSLSNVQISSELEKEKSKVKSLTIQVQNYETESKMLQEQCEKVQNQLLEVTKQSNHKLNESSSAIMDMQMKIQNFERKTKVTETLIADSKQQIDQMNEKIEQMIKENSELKLNIASINNQNLVESKRKDDLISVYQSDINKANSELTEMEQKMRKVIQDAKNKLEESASEIKVLTLKNSELSKALEQDKNLINTLETQVSGSFVHNDNMPMSESSVIAEPFLTGRNSTLSDIYAESSRNLANYKALKQQFEKKSEEHEKLRKEFDSKIPFFNELERKYQLSSKQNSQNNVNMTKLLVELDQAKMKISQLEANQGSFTGASILNGSHLSQSNQQESIRFLQTELERLKELRKKEQQLFDSVVKQKDIYKEKIEELNMNSKRSKFDESANGENPNDSCDNKLETSRLEETIGSLKNALDSKNQEQQNQIIGLTAENAKLSSKVEFLLDKNSLNETKIMRGDKELNTMQQYISQTLSLLEKTQKKYSEVSMNLEKSKSESCLLETKIKNSEFECNVLKQKIQMIMQDNNSLMAKIGSNDSTVAIDNLNKSINSNNVDSKLRQNVIETMQKTIDDQKELMDREIQNLKSQNVQLSNQIATLESEKLSLGDSMKCLENSKVSLEHELSKVKDEMSSVSEAKDNKFTEMEQKYSDEIAKLVAESADYAEKLCTEREDVRHFKQLADDMERALIDQSKASEMGKKMAEERKDYNEMIVKVNSLTDANNGLIAELNVKEEQLANSVQENEQIKQDFNNQINNHEVTFDAQVEIADQLKKQIMELKDQILKTESELQNKDELLNQEMNKNLERRSQNLNSSDETLAKWNKLSDFINNCFSFTIDDNFEQNFLDVKEKVDKLSETLQNNENLQKLNDACNSEIQSLKSMQQTILQDLTNHEEEKNDLIREIKALTEQKKETNGKITTAESWNSIVGNSFIRNKIGTVVNFLNTFSTHNKQIIAKLDELCQKYKNSGNNEMIEFNVDVLSRFELIQIEVDSNLADLSSLVNKDGAEDDDNSTELIGTVYQTAISECPSTEPGLIMENNGLDEIQVFDKPNITLDENKSPTESSSGVEFVGGSETGELVASSQEEIESLSKQTSQNSSQLREVDEDLLFDNDETGKSDNAFSFSQPIASTEPELITWKSNRPDAKNKPRSANVDENQSKKVFSFFSQKDGQ